MRPVSRWLQFNPVLVVALALVCATILVVYLQHRTLTTLDQQSTLIVERVLEQTANEIAADIRVAIDQPAYDTLRAFTGPQLQGAPLDRVLGTYEEAIRKYPHVDGFFIWTAETEARVPGEVLFFKGMADRDVPEREDDGWTAFSRDPELGPLIYQGARAHAGAQTNYTALEYRLGPCTYDVLVHNYRLEAGRDGFSFLLGVAVCVEQAGERLLSHVYRSQLADWLRQAEGGPPLDLTVFDEQHRAIFGSAQFTPGIATSVSFPAQFYPARLSSLTVAGDVSPREWTVRVSSAALRPGAVHAQSYWVLGLSVLLMLVALTAAVRGQKRASELAAMQAEFVSHVSHQLRTPLSLLTTVTETLALDRVRSPEKAAQYVDIIRTETTRLTTLVEGILEFSRVQGRRSYQREPVDLVPLVRETVGAFTQKLATEGFTIQVDVSDPSPMVDADPAALEQVLLNLLDNAVKYSAEVREVTVHVSRTASEAVVEVEDRGVGIPAADQSRIFDRFYRGAGAGRQRGFGLGLAVVREIVNAHRGRVEVESEVGRGSVFRVRLPLHNPVGRMRGAVRSNT
ncbi:MAG: HAMP domain-containing histidine kinase [Acidobacteria bacterium]|nr:HAMP domain-containing histidine kinase [Acidobacteriota bacterium]